MIPQILFFQMSLWHQLTFQSLSTVLLTSVVFLSPFATPDLIFKPTLVSGYDLLSIAPITLTLFAQRELPKTFSFLSNLPFCSIYWPSALWAWRGSLFLQNTQNPNEGRECERRYWLTCTFQGVDGPQSCERADKLSHPSSGHIARLAGIRNLFSWLIECF